MNVVVIGDDGAILWSFGEIGGQQEGIAVPAHVEDGTQEKIVMALDRALTNASVQLRGVLPHVPDVVTYIRPTAAKINGHMPMTGARNDNSGR